MPEDGPQADTTQSPSPLVAMLWTLMPGPGDHFDFVLMHANSEVPANDLFTTQSEADPLSCTIQLLQGLSLAVEHHYHWLRSWTD